MFETWDAVKPHTHHDSYLPLAYSVILRSWIDRVLVFGSYNLGVGDSEKKELTLIIEKLISRKYFYLNDC